MGRIVCLLQMCLKSTNLGAYPAGKFRTEQFIKGLTAFFRYNTILQNNDVDIYLTDNALPSDEQFPEEILNCLPPNVKVMTFLNNEYGSRNKGCGLIENWIFFKDILVNYEWLIHFEPRQELINFDFINNFLSSPRNLFYKNQPQDLCTPFQYRTTTDENGIDLINNDIDEFNTGLFCTKVKHIIDYINQIDLDYFVDNIPSIEIDIYSFYTNQTIEYDTLDKLGLIWHNYGLGRFHNL
jgi:hypothetical protein